MDGDLGKKDNRQKAQSAVEFALILPVLLMLIFGIIEFGRMLLIYITVTSSSREAARYGAAIGPNPSGLPRYLDCTGMANAAKKVGILAGLQDANIQISYDFGPTQACDPNLDRNGEKVSQCDCPLYGVGPSGLQMGDRVNVEINVPYTPILPLGFITNGFDIHSRTSRTVIKEVDVSAANIPPPPPPPSCTVSFDGNHASVDEGTAPGNYKTVSVGVIVEGNCGPITIPLGYSGTAKMGTGALDDYKDAPSSITILKNSSFSFSINEDEIHEAPETVVIDMGALSPFNAYPGSNTQFTFTIDNDDLEPNVSFTIGSQLVNENLAAPASFGITTATLQLDRPSSENVTVPFSHQSITAEDGTDYQVVTPSPITFAPYEMTKTIQVKINDDLFDEDDESLNLILDTNHTTGATVINPFQHMITIIDNDLPPLVYFELEQQFVTENTGDFKVRVLLSAQSSKPITVDFSAGGTATMSSDYTIATSSPINIPAFATGAEINLHMIKDTDDNEPNETILLTLSNPVNATLGLPKLHTVNIVMTTVSFKEAFQASPENIATMTAVLQLNLVSAVDITVPFMVSGTAWNGHDYTISASPVTIPAGSLSANITINMIDDTLYEDPETVILTMGNPTGASPGAVRVHTATIIDNDVMPVVAFAVASSSAMENIGQTVNIVVQLNTPSGKDVTVPFTVAGTATMGADYSISSSPVFIPAGSTSANISVDFVNDSAYEPGDTVIVSLGTPLNAALGLPNVHTLTILNDDPPACNVYSTDAYFDSKHAKFTLRLYNNGVNLEISQVLVTYDSNGSNLTQVQFGSPLWAGSDGSTANVMPPWLPDADPSFPGMGASKYMIFNFETDKYVDRMIKIQIKFVDAICNDYSRTDFP